MIFVAGGAGYIGSHCVRMLGERKYDVIIYDNLSRGHRDLVSHGIFIQGDLSDTDLMVRIFKEYDVDSVLHFAANSLVGESEENPHRYYLNNVANAIRLLDAMLRAGVGKIVFSSSAAVYGEPQSIPIEEDHPTRPENVYGHTKQIFEDIMKKYSRVYGLRFVSLRYFNAAGAAPDGSIGEDHTPETHLIPLVLDAALGRSKEITVFGTDYDTPDGTCIRDYIHVLDLAEAHLLALKRLENDSVSEIYNLGNGRGFSVREVVDTARKVTGKNIALRQGKRRPGDPARLVASSKKISGEMGWSARYPELEDIIGTAWNWHKKRFGK
ncbi:MAG: UDP-glucose 4-epimerase GalE [Syntrophales bacterium]